MPLLGNFVKDTMTSITWKTGIPIEQWDVYCLQKEIFYFTKKIDEWRIAIKCDIWRRKNTAIKVVFSKIAFPKALAKSEKVDELIF